MRRHQCQPGVRHTFIRNIAARGRLSTFTIRVEAVGGGPASGSVEVRNGALPFFLASHRQVLPLVDGMTVKRGFFDASFDLTVITDVEATVTVD